MIPADMGLSGEDDVVHLTHSVDEDRVMLSKNYRDFENLHNLVIRVGGQHPGILMVRQDNDRRRDMTDRTILRALANLLASNSPFQSQFIILNQWR